MPPGQPVVELSTPTDKSPASAKVGPFIRSSRKAGMNKHLERAFFKSATVFVQKIESKNNDVVHLITLHELVVNWIALRGIP